MKAKILKPKTPIINLKESDVVSFGVFSVEEMENLPQHILKFRGWYWTSGDSRINWDDGFPTPNKEAISPKGDVERMCSLRRALVRPFIKIKVSSITQDIVQFKKGDIINCFEYNWYYVDRVGSIITLFCMDSIGECVFSQLNTKTLYEDSELYKFVNDWWEFVKEEIIDQYPQFSIVIYTGKLIPEIFKSEDVKEINTKIASEIINGNWKPIDGFQSNNFNEITNRIDQEIGKGNWVQLKNNNNGQTVYLTQDDLK